MQDEISVRSGAVDAAGVNIGISRQQRVKRVRWEHSSRPLSADRAAARIGSVARSPFAAMLCEIPEQSIHPGKIRPIDQIASLLLDADQASMRELLEMKRQGVAGNAKLVSQDTGGEARKPGHDESAECA